MMITKEAADFDQGAKQEGDTSEQSKTFKTPSSSTTTWTRLKDPRIVRVSRAFGGKDRHSKVCTVRGLRDRRVRLSVPTAIQLYDLQDRLGFNQPSKVVDWLLNAAKHGIDELPPLQLPPGNFPQNLYPVLSADQRAAVGAAQAEKGLKTSTSRNWDDASEHPRLNVIDSDANLRAKSKGATDQDITHDDDDDDDDKARNWARNEEGKQTDHRFEGDHEHHAYALSNNFFPRPNQSSSLAVSLMNNSMPTNSFALRWDPSSLSLSHGGSHGLITTQAEEFHNFNVVPLPSTLHHMPSGSQVLVYPPGVMQPYFPPPTAEFDPTKHINLQILSSNSQNSFSHGLKQHVDDATNHSVRPFHFSMMANLPPASQRGEPNKDDDHDHFQAR